MSSERFPLVCSFGHSWSDAARHPADRSAPCPHCAAVKIPTDYYASGIDWANETPDAVRALVENLTGDILAADLAGTAQEVARYLLGIVAQFGAGDYDPADVLPADFAYLQATGLIDACRAYADAVGVAID